MSGVLTGEFCSPGPAPGRSGAVPRGARRRRALLAAGPPLKVVSATIAQDGTISVDYKVADPNGLPLDPAGITTPGAVSVSFLCAYIPKGQTQFYDYNTRVSAAATGTASATQASTDSAGTTKPATRLQSDRPTPTAATGTASATQASTDSGGTTKQVTDGEFIYTFKTKAVGVNGTAWDPTATHRVGIYGSRNLTEFDLGTNYASNTLDS